MKKIRYSIIIFLITSSIGVLGQLPQYSQYMFNDFILNPALAGVNDYYQIRTNHRLQWFGIQDQPITNSIAFYGPHTSLDMGYGGSILTDVLGKESFTKLSGSYAYNIAINNDLRVSMGLSASVLQYRLDGTQLDPKTPDQSIQNTISTSYVPDASIGIYLYGDGLYAGFSVLHLLNNKISVFENKNGLNELKTHFYLTGGYRFRINNDWVIEPSTIIKATAPKEIGFELTSRVEWMEMAWLGVGYRFHESIIVLAGYNYNNKFYFGYAYDIGISGLNNYNSGSHELMIGYRFNDIK